MPKSYLARITFDENAVDDQGRGIPLRWPDGSDFRLSVLDGPLNQENVLVTEMLWRGLGRFGIGAEVLGEVNSDSQVV